MLAFSIDDSGDIKKMEQCAIVLYLLHCGIREEHLLKFHALPGGKATGQAVARCASYFCTFPTEEVCMVALSTTPVMPSYSFHERS